MNIIVTDDEFFEGLFSTVPLMVILRGYGPLRSVELANQAWDLGVSAVEVPIQSQEALESFLAVIEAGRRRRASVGAGTVISLEQLDKVVQAGGAFTVSPGFSPSIASASSQRGIPHLGGVSTPSEIQQVLESGRSWMKVFPASVLGPEWFRAMRGPFPEAKLVATGGMAISNAREYLDAGANVVSLGGAIASGSGLEQVSSLLSR